MTTWITVLCKSMKLWAIPWRATQGQVVETYDKTWSTGEGNGKLLQPSCLENPMNSMKRQKDMTLKDELPRSVGAQYATGEEWRNSSRRNEKTKPRNWKTLLGSKAVTNLYSIFKSRGITLLAKFCIVRAMGFPIVMYGCENWTIKKAECRKIDAFGLEKTWESLGQQRDQTSGY